MSGIFCKNCWFRKTTTGEETHNTFRSELNEGDCIITKKPCDHEWDSHDKAMACPTLREFYWPTKKAKAKQKDEAPRKSEQMSLFDFMEEQA